MKTKTTPRQKTKEAAPRRRYDSPVRRQQSAETLERILAAGAELLRGLAAWDLKSLNARAVSEHTGIGLRTVHRYFPTDRRLRDAVLQRTVEESGISLAQLKVDEFADVTAQMFRILSSFSAAPIVAPVDDPTLAVMDQDRCDAVLNAVIQATPNWTERERKSAAAALDILWSVPTYDRLIGAWKLDADQTIETVSWLIRLTTQAIQQGRKPGGQLEGGQN